MKTSWEDVLGALLIVTMWVLSIAWGITLIWGTVKVVGWLISL